MKNLFLIFYCNKRKPEGCTKSPLETSEPTIQVSSTVERGNVGHVFVFKQLNLSSSGEIPVTKTNR